MNLCVQIPRGARYQNIEPLFTSLFYVPEVNALVRQGTYTGSFVTLLLTSLIVHQAHQMAHICLNDPCQKSIHK